MRVTVNNISQAIEERTGQPGITLEKDAGVYYWVSDTNPVMEQLEERCTHMMRLSDWPLQRWVGDFESRLEMRTGY